MPYVLGNVAGLVLLVVVLVSLARWVSSGVPPWVLRPVIDRVEAWLASRRPEPEPLPPVLMALELSRIAAHLRFVEESDLPRKPERLMAARLAYDHTLRDYCRAVGIPVPPAIRGLSAEQRFAMEEALISAGHEW